ncbi:MAG TPA: methyltransferase domain-containing protein, partial [Acidimicrobiia bacterium]|nr:methyltransferase domain-containing protein [Acidimicrobiia bacterium]
LDAIGVEPGWRCLELGAGAGSVAQILCRRVGPAGRVVAVDLDTRFLEELREENLDVDRRDVLAGGLPGDAYDLVHARALLMHLPTREKLVGEMAATLRAGGWLLVEDLDTYPLQTLAEGVYADVMHKAIAAFHAANAASTFGRQLPALFDAAGLEDVEAFCEVMTYRGGSPAAQLIMASMDQMRPPLLAVGATEDQLDDMRRVLADPANWFAGFAVYSVRGRVPAT